MAKRRWDLNSIYISERLQECLRPIARSALTTVVAPMGYGKTTAVNWYLGERTKLEQARVLRISVYSDNLAIFWKSTQDAFSRAGLDVLQGCACPTDTAGAGLLVDDLCHALGGQTPCYLFIDDFHLLTDLRVPRFLCMLTNRLPENVHLIVASRDRFLPADEVLRLGGRLYRIGMEQLRLNHTELSIYAHRCGTELTDAQIEELLYSSEGWFSAVYLNLRTLSERGTLPEPNSDIYTMFSAAMIDPLPPRRQEFLAVMGLADEFTAEMAQFISGNKNAAALIAAMTEQNAFVTRLADGETFRFHHMMKSCAERAFRTLKPEKQRTYENRYGQWYEAHGQYLHALRFYRRSGDHDAMLRVIQSDAGILLAALKPSEVLAWLAECPEAALKKRPFAILVLMRSMFNWRQIPKMLELKALLLTAIEERPDMPEEERGDLLGECDLIMSFLCYNDISAMSRLHRSASSQMSHPAISIRNEGGWTFGSPSVLMMFHRAPGLLPQELREMEECMPHYYRITNGHGRGAERIMDAEAAFQQGRFSDAQIALESAYAQIEGNGQENMALCCDFLAWRMTLCTDVTPRYTFAQRREELKRHHNAAWIKLLDASCAYYWALRGRTEQIPEAFAEHRLASLNFLAPGKPMMELIENQVYLAQEVYARVIARSEGLLAECAGLHYALVALHIRIQTAAAYNALGKRTEALELLNTALREAAPDRLLIPFAENYRWLRELLPQCADSASEELAGCICTLGERYAARLTPQTEAPAQPEVLSALTAREKEIAGLAAARLSNREIAEKLFLSEGSVKQYINQIYAKLGLDGDTRTKRRRLSELLNDNP